MKFSEIYYSISDVDPPTFGPFAMIPELVHTKFHVDYEFDVKMVDSWLIWWVFYDLKSLFWTWERPKFIRKY